MSPQTTPTSTPLTSQRPDLENGLASAPDVREPCEGELAARIEQQRSKIRALEVEAGARREADRFRIQERLARVTATKEVWQQRRLLDLARQAVSSPPSSLPTPQRLDGGFREQIKATLQESKGVHFDRQEELRLKDRQAQDESAKQTDLRYEAAEQARKIEFDVRHKRWLAEAKAKKIREAEQKQAWHDQQDKLRRADRQRRDESAVQALWRHKAAADERRAQDEAIRQERLAEMERQRLARLREQEQRRLLDLRQDERRRRERLTRDESAMQAHLRYTATIEAQKAGDKAIRDSQAQAAQSVQDDDLRRDRDRRRNQQKLLAQEQILPFEGLVPSFLEEEFQYMKRALTTFPEVTMPSIQMSCMKAYQKAISDASKRLPCGLCGGLFHE